MHQQRLICLVLILLIFLVLTLATPEFAVAKEGRLLDLTGFIAKAQTVWVSFPKVLKGIWGELLDISKSTAISLWKKTLSYFEQRASIVSREWKKEKQEMTQDILRRIKRIW